MRLLDRIFDTATVPDSAVEYAIAHPGIEVSVSYDDATGYLKLLLTDGLTRVTANSHISDVMTTGKDGPGVNAFWLAPIVEELGKTFEKGDMR